MTTFQYTAINPNIETICPICRDPMDPVDRQNIGHIANQNTRVGHVFHEACIIPWLATNQTCPSCRIDVANVLDFRELTAAGRGWLVREAVGNGQQARVEVLLANDAQISEENRSWAVREAVGNGHLAIVKLLLENGAQISEENRGSAVCGAAENGHLAIVKLLLENDAQILEERRGWAVCQAAENGHLAIVEFLLANGAQILEEHRGLAVQKAAENNHHNIVLVLQAQNQSRHKTCTTMVYVLGTCVLLTAVFAKRYFS